MHPFLMDQNIDYQFYVVEPVAGLIFNKALAMNAAFKEVVKQGSYDCILFHDVDMLPEVAELRYECSEKAPKHFVVALNERNYT